MSNPIEQWTRYDDGSIDHVYVEEIKLWNFDAFRTLNTAVWSSVVKMGSVVNVRIKRSLRGIADLCGGR